jgi:hypothetical protein
MTLVIVLIIAAVLGLVFLVRVTLFADGLRPGASQQLEIIDLDAFRNLVDPAETEYLRRRLPALEFRRVQRARLRAMASYVHAAGQNAAALMKIGQSALEGSDAQTSQAARELVDNALLLRRNATFALFRIYVALAWPDAGLTAVPILHDYERVNGFAMLLGRLQNPAARQHVSTVS